MFFTFIYTVTNAGYKSPLFLLPRPEAGLEWDLKGTTSTFFFITSLHTTLQAKEPTWCKLNLFGEEDCFFWTSLQFFEANSTVEIQVFENPNMAFSSSNALSSTSPLRSRKKSRFFPSLSHFPLFFFPLHKRTGETSSLPSFLWAGIGK